MNIYGLNIASSTQNPNGRGWIDPQSRRFVYLPIDEIGELAGACPTFRQLGFRSVKAPDLHAHVDPEFTTFTYGHITRGFGDSRMWDMKAGDILFFYASLDRLPERTKWGLYILGYFTVKQVCDTRGMSDAAVKRLKGFQNNAHMKRKDPAVELLVQGSADSRLFREAIPLSDPKDCHRLHPNFVGKLTTVSGKPLRGNTWHRWFFISHNEGLGQVLKENP